MTSDQDQQDWKPMFDLGESEGVNDSERVLARLCRKSFLRLWAQTNVFNDEGFHAGKGSAKEMCDALVVFGKDVLIFSDKHIHFQHEKTLEIAWPRWYRRAVVESIRQLHGAMNWMRRFPTRAFLDSACTRPLPVSIPTGDDVTFHLIAVTRGTKDAVLRHFGGEGRGTLALDTSVVGNAHEKTPFTIGIPVPNKPFVHVFDEAAIEIVLAELDTAADFVAYLSERKAFLQTAGRQVRAFGEEDLLASYLQNMDADEERHQFLPPGVEASGAPDLVLFDNSFFDHLEKNDAYVRKKKADEISYFWDDLVDRFIRIGDPNLHGMPLVQSNAELEEGLRLLAGETRFRRRILSEAIKGQLQRVGPGQRAARLADPGVAGQTVYVFLTVPRLKDESYDDYRKHRIALLHAYTMTAKLIAPLGTVFVGLAFDNPYKDYKGSSEDLFVYMQTEWSEAQLHDLEDKRRDLGLWGDQMQKQDWHGTEFPEPQPQFFPGGPAQSAASRKDKTKKRREKMKKASQRKNRK
jgi:hypothetical protein